MMGSGVFAGIFEQADIYSHQDPEGITVEDELRLFKKLNIDFLVVKNSGGSASESKLKAASILDIPVIMLNRPDYSNFNKVSSINDCLDWISKFE